MSGVDSSSPPASNNDIKKLDHVVTIRDRPIYLQEDWNSGIGGGLWSTGLALAKYFDTTTAQHELGTRKIKRVLELGSGNAFLAVCLLAACPTQLEQIVVTDTKEHLSLMNSTLEVNSIRDFRTEVIVQEYLWGTGPIRLHKSNDGNDGMLQFVPKFDLILGSDLAYRDELHDVLIQAIVDCSTEKTLTLLGITMNDTKPKFFTKLSAANLRYERLADHLIDPAFRGTNFGIFAIQRLCA